MKPPAWLLPLVFAVAAVVTAFVFLRPSPADVTDGHLLNLATHHGAKLATFDTGIPGAELIKQPRLDTF